MKKDPNYDIQVDIDRGVINSNGVNTEILEKHFTRLLTEQQKDPRSMYWAGLSDETKAGMYTKFNFTDEEKEHHKVISDQLNAEIEQKAGEAAAKAG